MGAENIFQLWQLLPEIINKLKNNYSNNLVTTTIQTDLSSAFDTVDHCILIKKLEHFGVNCTESKIFRSFLSNRQQYFEIDTFASNILNSLDYSVVQGSKLSSLLYTIYINEIPLLNKIMGTNFYSQIVNKFDRGTYNTVLHDIFQYVDYTSNIIASSDISEL